MFPTLFTIPIFQIPVRSYPFFILIGFILALITARRRAKKVGADAEPIATIFLILAFFGLIGSRAMYVIHYWERDFAHLQAPWRSAIQLYGGGAELLGGVTLSILVLLIYLMARRLPVKLYLDILVPSVLLAQAFGRMACFAYGCCWGSICLTSSGDTCVAWAVEFPYGSPAHQRHCAKQRVSVPVELMYNAGDEKYPVPADFLSLSESQFESLIDQARNIVAAPADDAKARDDLAWARKTLAIEATLARDSQNTSATYESLLRRRELANQLHSLPVHPVQLYVAINTLLLSILFAVYFKRRSHDGLVLAGFLILYPLTRVLQEAIRGDNPRDTFGMTVSTAMSLVMVLLGLLLLLCWSRKPRQYRHPDSGQSLPWTPGVDLSDT